MALYGGHLLLPTVCMSKFPNDPRSQVCKKPQHCNPRGGPSPHQRWEQTFPSGLYQYPNIEMNKPLRLSMGSVGFVLPKSQKKIFLRAYIKDFNQERLKVWTSDVITIPNTQIEKESFDNARTIQNQSLHMTYCPKDLVWCPFYKPCRNEHGLSGKNQVLLYPQRNLAAE